MFKKEKNNIANFSFILILLFMLFYILYIGASLIIPFIIALLFSFAIIWLSNFFKWFKIPTFISFILSLWVYSFMFWLVWRLIWSNIDELIKLLPEYQTKVLSIVSQIFQFIHVAEPKSITEVLQSINLQYFFSLAVSGFTSTFSKAGIILFYVMFILLEYRYFKEKLHLMFVDTSKRQQILEIIEKIRKDIKSYFVIKTIVSFLTALFSYIIMTAFWLDFAIFWSMLVFILNFIPSIWSIIAVIFPALFSLVQFDGYYSFLIMTSGLVWIQVLMWNIIEPRFMWNKLNISPLVIIISLAFWWSLWWVIGMLLSVPIMVIINIILAKIPVTRPIAILLSEKWEIEVDWGEEVIETRKRMLKKIKDKFKKNKLSKK
jgi:AI-2 transport protein TqsA